MNMLTALALHLLATIQLPQECLAARQISKGPFCVAATHAISLEELAQARSSEHDSVSASITSFNLQTVLTTIAYWRLERARIADRACSDLQEFDWDIDTTITFLPDAICDILSEMETADSLSFSYQTADLEHPEALTISARATRDAALRQRVDALSRRFFAASLAFTPLLTTTTPRTHSD